MKTLIQLLNKEFIIGSRPQNWESKNNTPAPWSEDTKVWIEQALQKVKSKNTGGWFVISKSRFEPSKSLEATIHDKSWVFWQGRDQKCLMKNECPHMGAELSDSKVLNGKVICPWHGLGIGQDYLHKGKSVIEKTYDDGILFWARLDEHLGSHETLLERPILPQRPTIKAHAVVELEAECTTDDVIYNRLDPWHGSIYHPHTFARLKVLSMEEDSILIRVVYRLSGPVGIEVDARFYCPDSRTIAMEIVEGEGRDSVIETHATPIFTKEKTQTKIIEANLMTTDRKMMWWLPFAQKFTEPYLKNRALRLWKEDAEYCEKIFQKRNEK